MGRLRMPLAETVVALGLGSNLGQPSTQLRRAFGELSALPQTRLLRESPLYRSTAIGPDGGVVSQPDFCNAAALLETGLAPQALLAELQALEAAHGRRPQTRAAARCLDLDILVYGDHVIDLPGLSVPHPRMAGRNFVMRPLCDIAPGLRVPGLGLVREIAATLGTGGLQPWRD